MKEKEGIEINYDRSSYRLRRNELLFPALLPYQRRKINIRCRDANILRNRILKRKKKKNRYLSTDIY